MVVGWVRSCIKDLTAAIRGNLGQRGKTDLMLQFRCVLKVELDRRHLFIHDADEAATEAVKEEKPGKRDHL